MNNRIVSATIAATATATAIGLSAVAGTQRGGWESERALLIAMGVVLVVAAHLIPALTRGMSAPGRLIGFAIWAAAMAATCYGHATFFVFAASHAGDDRATLSSSPHRRTLGRFWTSYARLHALLVSSGRSIITTWFVAPR